MLEDKAWLTVNLRLRSEPRLSDSSTQFSFSVSVCVKEHCDGEKQKCIHQIATTTLKLSHI